MKSSTGLYPTPHTSCYGDPMPSQQPLNRTQSTYTTLPDQRPFGSGLSSQPFGTFNPDVPLPSIERDDEPDFSGLSIHGFANSWVGRWGTALPDPDVPLPSIELDEELEPQTFSGLSIHGFASSNSYPSWTGRWVPMLEPQPPQPCAAPLFPSKLTEDHGRKRRRFTPTPFPRKDPRTGYIAPVLFRGREDINEDQVMALLEFSPLDSNDEDDFYEWMKLVVGINPGDCESCSDSTSVGSSISRSPSPAAEQDPEVKQDLDDRESWSDGTSVGSSVSRSPSHTPEQDLDDRESWSDGTSVGSSISRSRSPSPEQDPGIKIEAQEEE
ncbi:hypothetical protein B0T21DRAFT_406540 [Apiosordaria backusii]|uniref:Uncharacterized protein n=1 Tax=Apiosordaria backusii TaxID=314023 RepID=A0AA40EZ32_9PEZI|nr:hypothetical protein B0T21DRAFT_406540 [Apiosordaria backusii]